MTHIEMNRARIMCEDKQCPKFLMFYMAVGWWRIDIAVEESEWKAFKKNGTWHHFCPLHKDSYTWNDV